MKKLSMIEQYIYIYIYFNSNNYIKFYINDNFYC
jgi:hypothetical protein